MELKIRIGTSKRLKRGVVLGCQVERVVVSITARGESIDDAYLNEVGDTTTAAKFRIRLLRRGENTVVLEVRDMLRRAKQQTRTRGVGRRTRMEWRHAETPPPILD